MLSPLHSAGLIQAPIQRLPHDTWRSCTQGPDFLRRQLPRKPSEAGDKPDLTRFDRYGQIRVFRWRPAPGTAINPSILRETIDGALGLIRIIVETPGGFPRPTTSMVVTMG